jgi:NADH-quinone oxidoreductase subunit L
MRFPLIVLAIGAIAAGFVFEHQFIGEGKAEFWRGAIYNAPGPIHAAVAQAHAASAAAQTAEGHAGQGSRARGSRPGWCSAPLVASILGLLVAAYIYIVREGLGARLAARAGPLYVFFYNKWFFDELYQATFVRAAKFLGDLFWKGGDQKIIDGLGPDGVAAVSLGRWPPRQPRRRATSTTTPS